MTLRIETLSVFPEVFKSYMSTSIVGRARARHLFEFQAHNLRTWTHDRHHTVDDAPFGGGQGMLMKPAPFYEAIRELSSGDQPRPHVVFFTPVGTPFTQHVAERLSHEQHIILVCGRYEGIDERAYALADECLSLGDYVLTGGELPALVVTDAIVRLLPGALGDEMSNQDESFSRDGLLEYAQYTRPASFEGMSVPDVLLSGNHEAVAQWRRRSSVERTVRWRPDMLEHITLSPEEQRWVRDVSACTSKESHEPFETRDHT